MDLNQIGSICSIISLLATIIIALYQCKISKDINSINTKIGNTSTNTANQSPQRGIIGNSNSGDISNNRI
jgi:hypothetical protein